MMVLITYDVNTQDASGRARLRKISKQCVNYGQRVQNSVFECLLDPAQCKKLQHELLSIMDCNQDSLRFITWAISTGQKSNILAPRPAMSRKVLSSFNRMRSGNAHEISGMFAPKISLKHRHL